MAADAYKTSLHQATINHKYESKWTDNKIDGLRKKMDHCVSGGGVQEGGSGRAGAPHSLISK